MNGSEKFARISHGRESHFPPRQALGAVLLDANRPAEAETVYWEDLRRNKESGWSLFGLMQALKAQGKKVYVPDLNAFRTYAQKKYVDKYGSDWPKGALERINSI